MFQKQALPFVLPALILALVAASAPADDLSVDEIIAKNIETRGGIDALKAVKSARMDVNLSFGEMQMPATMIFKRPHMARFEMEMQGSKIVQAYDGETGWGIMPMMGSTEPAKLADDQLKQIQDQSDFDGPLVDYEEKGHTVELVGKEDVEGTEAYKLKLTKKNGDVVHFFLDTEYFLVFKLEGRANMQGTEVNTVSEVSDYKEVGNIVMPHFTKIVPEGAPQGMTFSISNVELNVDVNEEQFAFPELAAPAAEESDKEKSEG